MRNLNDKNAQLQKQVENVVREANSEISLLNNKTAELERDLELERRKVRELQDASRDREKEYQKLKLLHDKFKRKALLAPHPSGHDGHPGFGAGLNDDQHSRQRAFGTNIGNAVNLSTVVGGMEANGVQRTPIVNRTMAFVPQGQMQPKRDVGMWAQQQPAQQGHVRNKSRRQPFAAPADRSYRSITDQSDSANEVENMLVNSHSSSRVHPNHAGWTVHQPLRANGFAANAGTRRTTSKFRPAGGMGR